VGTFDLFVTAKPREVAVGDPITLTMTVLDRSSPPVDLNLIQPPRLEADAELMRDFRVAGDQPTGEVQETGRRKVFTQTIRAKSDKVTAIPPIEFSFFDPDRQRYATIASPAIPLEVRATTTLADSDIVDAAPAARTTAATELTVVEGGLLANYMGPELLAATPPFRVGPVPALVGLLPPLAFMMLAAGVHHARRRRGDRSVARRRGARRRARRRLHETNGSTAAATATAIADYVADRCNLPAGALTAAEVIARLRACGVDGELVDEVAGLLADCERQRYAGDRTGQTDAVVERAERCLDRLEREKIR